eukprot:scaffold2021_cov176-Amphora_coffeaeformis.AAC.20
MGPGYNVAVECEWGTPFGDLFALLMIRNSLHVQDFSWYQYDQDIAAPAIDFCRWKRIQCDFDKNVTGLIFNNAGLSGSLPPEAAGLKHLQHLHLFDNEGLAGHLPTQLGRLSALLSLKIHETNIGDTVPTELGKLIHLQEALLEETLLTGHCCKWPLALMKAVQLARSEAGNTRCCVCNLKPGTETTITTT